MTRGEGGSKITKMEVTSFVDSPFPELENLRENTSTHIYQLTCFQEQHHTKEAIQYCLIELCYNNWQILRPYQQNKHPCQTCIQLLALPEVQFLIPAKKIDYFYSHKKDINL